MIGGRLRQIFHRVRGRLIEFDLTPYQRLLTRIDARGDEIKRHADSRLKELSSELIARTRAGFALDSLLVEAFALGREVSSRVLGMRHFDVQMFGGIALHQGKLVEMQTGEGKTLAAVLPAYLNAADRSGRPRSDLQRLSGPPGCAVDGAGLRIPGLERRFHPGRHGPPRPTPGLRL